MLLRTCSPAALGAIIFWSRLLSVDMADGRSLRSIAPPNEWQRWAANVDEVAYYEMQTATTYALGNQKGEEISDLTECRRCGDYAKVASETVPVGMQKSYISATESPTAECDVAVIVNNELSVDLASLEISLVIPTIPNAMVDIRSDSSGCTLG